MTKRFVSGANGFIGSHLIKRLEKLEGNTMGLHHSYFQCNHYYNVDQIFFLSTYGNMAHHRVHRMMIQANVGDLLSILPIYEGWLCYMSSSSVTLPVQTPYSRTKRAAEEILQALPELKSCIVRPYSVTGRHEQREHLIPTLIRSCLEGEEMLFDPYPVHDFVDVSDLVDALIQLSDHQLTGIFEIGNGIGYTNQAVLELVEEITGRKANIKQRTGLRPYDNLEWVCKSSYRIKPPKSLATSITEMVEAYKRERSGA